MDNDAKYFLSLLNLTKEDLPEVFARENNSSNSKEEETRLQRQFWTNVKPDTVAQVIMVYARDFQMFGYHPRHYFTKLGLEHLIPEKYLKD